MVKAAEQDSRTFSQRSKMLVEFVANVLLGSKNGVFNFAFDVSMTEFFRVDVRCVCRQALNVNFRMRSQVGLCQLAVMGAGTIPDENERLLNLAAKMFQALNELG